MPLSLQPLHSISHWLLWLLSKLKYSALLEDNRRRSRNLNNRFVSSWKNRRSRKQTNRDSKAIRTLGTLMGLFCISWLPFFFVYIIKPFCPSCFLPHWLDSIITWLGYCNSFINPCIYGYLNRDFQMAYKSLLCCEKKADKTIRRNHLQMAATSPTEELQRTPLQEQLHCNELNVDTRILADTMLDINIYHGL